MVSKGFCGVLSCFSVREMQFCGRMCGKVLVMSEDILCEVLFDQCVMGFVREVMSVWQKLGSWVS